MAKIKHLQNAAGEQFYPVGHTNAVYDNNGKKLETRLSDDEAVLSDLNNEVANKIDKVSGKGLSANDYTTAEKNKLSGIASGAEVNVQSDWDVTDTTSDAYIKNKPTSMPASDVPAWAKAQTKPSYTKGEVGLENVDNKSSATIRSEITKENVTSALGYTPPTTNTTYSTASTSEDGLMSKDDKTKLDGIDIGANKTVVDATLSNTSENPVQNKVIKQTIDSEIARATAQEELKAPLESPTLTGTPKAPTPSADTNNTQIATTAFVNTAVSNHNSSSTAHNDIRTLIANLTTRLNALADSDDTTLDQLSEIVAYIKDNRSLIDSVTTSKVNVSDIVDNLTSTTTNKPLSAKQGKVLKGLIDALTSVVDDKVDKVSGKGLSTNDYTTAEKNKLAGIADNANNYTLPLATASVRGGVKIGYTANGKNYPVQLSNEQMYVNVPWTDTNTQTITGVKGNAESGYRTGNVNLTPENIGALSTAGGTITGNLRLKIPDENYGNKLNFGDGDYVYLYEYDDDELEIKANTLKLIADDIIVSTPINGDVTGNAGTADEAFKAVRDGNGDVISNTYVKNNSIPNFPGVSLGNIPYVYQENDVIWFRYKADNELRYASIADLKQRSDLLTNLFVKEIKTFAKNAVSANGSRVFSANFGKDGYDMLFCQIENSGWTGITMQSLTWSDTSAYLTMYNPMSVEREISPQISVTYVKKGVM